MRKKLFKNSKKAGVGKVVTGIVVGGVVGATVGWLTAPGTTETRRRFLREGMSARDRVKTANENIESQARELAAEVR